MARKIETTFLNEFKTGILNPLLSYVQNDDTLDMELRGNSVIIYYRGGKILTINESCEMVELDKQYLSGKIIEKPSLATFEKYLPQAKHIVDYFILNSKHNHLGEKEIQQRIVQENNYSQNSSDTDYFIIDMEYQDIGRADIVALRWDSTSSARKLPKDYLPTITIFEVKQGFKSISGKSGMKSHLTDFINFVANKAKIDAFKQDMIAIFEQKKELKLIRNIDKYKRIDQVSENIEFVFLLANYKPASKKLEQELEKIDDDCKFIYANTMGYGLYAKNIIDKQRFIKLFLCKSPSIAE